MTGMEVVGTSQRSIARILEKACSQERITSEEALSLLLSGEFHRIGQAADCVRVHKHPEGKVSFLIDRNISYTNVCVARCTFAPFAISIGSRDMKKAISCLTRPFLRKLKRPYNWEVREF